MHGFDWAQIWEIAAQPDNVPILILFILVAFYTWYAMRQAFANDRLIAELEKNPELAKTHHRKTWPFKDGWPQMVHVWPYLLKIEFLAALVVMTFLVVWSLVLQAPLEEPANPNLTMNPAKAPWYFLGLQEILVYFDPWIAGVIMPGLVLGGLMILPYCDVNPLGNGYYTWRQRKFALSIWFFGFFVLWLALTFIGVFLRGPGWMWFNLGETWDAHRVVNETYRHLYQVVGLPDDPKGSLGPAALFGFAVVGAYFAIGAGFIHVLYQKLNPWNYKRMNLIQYKLMIVHLLLMFSLPIKIFLWHGLHIKYVVVTPWFNI